MDISSKEYKKIFKYIVDDRHKKLKKYIKKKEISINAILNSKGEKMVHVCCREGATDCLEYLVSSGAKVNLVDKSGNLPIHNAVRYCIENYTPRLESDLVSFLLTYSSGLLNVQNFKRETAKELIDKLEEMKQNARDRDDQSRRAQDSISISSDSEEDDWRSKLQDECDFEYQSSFGRFENDNDYLFDQPDNFDAWADRIYASFSERRRRAYAPPPSQASRGTTCSTNSPSSSKPHKKLKPEIDLVKAKAITDKLRQEKKLKKIKDKSDKLFDSNEPISIDDLPYACMKANEIVDAMLGHCSNDSEDVIKKIIREEVRRWHPDKFKQKIGHRIIDGQREKVLEEVKRIAQAILSYAK